LRDVLEIKLEGMNQLVVVFAYLLSDMLAEYNAFAFVKKDLVAVDLSHAPKTLTLNKIIDIIRDCMNSLGLKDNYTLIIEDDKLVIKIANPALVEDLSRKYRSMEGRLYICPHCGYATPYPELLREHIKIHYYLL
jgi:aconitase B